MKIQSFAEGAWFESKKSGILTLNAVSGDVVGEVSSDGLNIRSMLEYGRQVGGPKLRALTFHKRALILKEIAKYLMQRKDEFYAISSFTGATKVDSWIDIEGGIGTFFAYSSRGRRELPNETFYVEGNMEQLSKEGSFVGRHLCVPLEGVAVHINAFNFPCWGMLEKLAPTFLAGMPAIVKPASLTCYLTESIVKAMLESYLLPEGALQLICGGVGDLFDNLTCQDVVTFTGSASTGRKLKNHPSIIENAVRFNMESDSLNCSILGQDATEDSEEFELFIKEVAKEMTVKAGQKCTAIRRAFVPKGIEEKVIDALKTRLDKIVVGDPAHEGVRMGPLASRSQVEEVKSRVDMLKNNAEIVYGDYNKFDIQGGNKEKGAFFPAMLLYCNDPLSANGVHDIEAFGPVSTVMPYNSIDEVIELAARGQGSLVGSLVTRDDNTAKKIVLGLAPYHGRLLLLNRDCAKESTGHGSPLPHLIHGGPGRAGGGEEMGGIRAVLHYMQRTALQGSPTMLSKVCNTWMQGASGKVDNVHPFRKHFEELEIGETLITHRRTITEADIVNFAALSGDHFYAHTDDIAAKESIFEKRVAHGYFIISAAAGLFVDPSPGPVLANYGLENLRFTKPVFIGDTIQVKLVVQQKTGKEGTNQGVVTWAVEVTNQDNELVATYSILTLVSCLT
jgi:oxepin-CoA hydrolase / 3-oxo-5,6-dehydrosuberyl-CoA semialdehyde dehydrogenase